MENFEKTINDILKDLELIKKGLKSIEELNETRYKELAWKLELKNK